MDRNSWKKNLENRGVVEIPDVQFAERIGSGRGGVRVPQLFTEGRGSRGAREGAATTRRSRGSR